MTKQRFHLLDVGRGIAAILVVALHFGNLVGKPIVPNGDLAVDYFIALSGFVIARAYGGPLDCGLSAFKFAETRFVRLYPLILLGTALGALREIARHLTQGAAGFSTVEAAVSFIATLVLLPTPWSISKLLYPLNPPTWSLLGEGVANGLFTIRFFRSALVAALVALCTGAVVIYHGVLENDSWAGLPFMICRVLYCFSAGIMIARFQYFPKVRTWWALVLPVILATALIFDAGTYEHAYRLIGSLVLMPALVILGSLFEIPARLERSSAFLGDISYPVYIIHLPLLTSTWFIAKGRVDPSAFLTVFLVALIAGAAVLAKVDAAIRIKLSDTLRVRRSARLQSGQRPA
jgi:peptidoglycan/LPS O-acetylase OafA/YrhL